MHRHCRAFILVLLSGFLVPGTILGQAGGDRKVQIGINLQEVDHPESRQLGVKATEGATITKVFPQSSAELAGLKAGDVVVKCGDRKIANCNDLRSVILGSSSGNKHRVEFYRGPQLLFVDLVVGQAPQPGGQTTAGADRRPYLGMRAVSANTASAKQMGIESPFGAAIESVVPGGPAAKAGFRRGDLIVDFGGQEITNYDEIAAALGRSPIGSRQRVFFVRNNGRHETMVVIGSRSGDAIKPDDTQNEKPAGSQISPPLPQPVQPPATPVDQPPQTPPDGWVTKTIGEVTVSIPPDWTTSEFVAADEGLWYKGSALLPEASFSIVRNAPFADLSRGGITKSKTDTAIGRFAAERHWVETSTATDPEKGIVVVIKQPVAGGGSMALVCFALSAQWDQYEPVFQKVLACIRIREVSRAESK